MPKVVGLRVSDRVFHGFDIMLDCKEAEYVMFHIGA